MWRKLFDVFFWLGVSVYFGGMVVVGAIVAPAVFATATSAKLSMPGIASPPLEMDRQVGGEIFGAILNRFAYVEAASLVILLVAIAGWILTHRSVRRSTWLIAFFWLCILGLTLYDGFAVRSRVWSMRAEVRKTAAAHIADKDGAPWPERAAFDALHRQSEAIGRWKVYLLFAMLLTGAWRGLAEKKRNDSIRRTRVLTPVP